MITRVEAVDVIRTSRRSLGLPASTALLDEVLLAALIRRAAAHTCPCSSRTLIRAALAALNGLAPDPDQLQSQVETAVDRATLAGDLLELSQVTTDDPTAKGTWVFCAPPSFVARPNGGVFLMGITGDEPNALPNALAARIEYDTYFRMLRSKDSEDLPQVLRELGLLELSNDTWFRAPKQEAASVVVSRFKALVMALGPAGDVSGLQVLDTSLSPTYYRGRWVPAKTHTGCFVARRPQAYGADIWGYALLEDGRLLKFLDLPRKHDRWRGADLAWHLQMAIDEQSGAPQRYRLRKSDGQTIIDFFSPIPLWAERRLAVFGRPAPRDRCLFSYQIAEAELATEEAFLRAGLWLAPVPTQGND